jgi:hypothetical protein
MIILVSYSAATYRAQIRSSLENGFKPLYAASCTMGEEAAAKAVVAKNFGPLAEMTVRQITDQAEILALVGDFKNDPQRKQVFTYWTFSQKASARENVKLGTSNLKPEPSLRDGRSQTSLLDPRFEAARKHADTIRRGLRMTVASCVALGLELLKLKDEVGAKHGGSRGASLHDANLKWPKLVERETGFNYVRCQDFMRAARAVRDRITASRKKGDAQVKLIATSPPSTWTEADYEAFAQHIGDAFEADTFKALLLDLGFGPKPVEPEPRLEHPLQRDFYDDMMAAHDCIAVPILDLHRQQINPLGFIRSLCELPIEDLAPDPETGRPRIFGLQTLAHILTTAGEQVQEALKAKRKGARNLPA